MEKFHNEELHNRTFCRNTACFNVEISAINGCYRSLCRNAEVMIKFSPELDISVKGKVIPLHARCSPELYSSMTAALEGGEWSASRPGRTLPPGKTR